MTSDSVPTVSVGVPVYNAARYLSRSLAALQSQSLQDIEIIISDNGSTDSTADIVRDFMADDPRFCYLRSERNLGLPANYNRALGAAKAPLFMWNAADDMAEPAHLQLCQQALEDHPSASIAFGRVQLIDNEDRPIGEMDDADLDFFARSPGERVALFLQRNAFQVIGFGGVIRTAELRAMGGLPGFYGGDGVLALRMAMRNPWVQLPQKTYRSRRHDRQTNKLQGADVIDQVRAFEVDRHSRFAFPQWYLNYQMLKEAASAPCGGAERLRATVSVLRWWTLKNWRFFPYDVKRNAVRLLRGSYQGAYSAKIDT